jgi:L,D-transpeptidase YcbB
MRINNITCPLAGILVLLLVFVACNNEKKEPVSTDIASSPQELDEKAHDRIRETLKFASDNNGNIGNSIVVSNPALLEFLYSKNEHAPFWSSEETWKPLSDSMFSFIESSKLYGLFPSDYHFEELDTIRKRFIADSLFKGDRKDAVLWSRADIMLTDALFRILKDIKLGRLPQDSITLRKDSVLNDAFYEQQFNILQKTGSITRLVRPLEPKHEGYHRIKAGIQKFLDSADYRIFTQVPSPGKDPTTFRWLLQKRLFEGGFFSYDSILADSVELVPAIRKFQQKKGITVDGKAGEGTVRMLNVSDQDRFIRIAISLDKYKMLPDKMPSRYIWVNLPGYYLHLIDNDSVILSSKVICGKPITRTPQLTSAISEMITYPQWTVPASIIAKEILPAVKKNTGYLARKGFSLVDKDGNEVNPDSVNWSKYKKGIPYKVVQGSGDANALGILKFNFNNKYAVYLHDTNQRYLFANVSRALSHGCVRVQDWHDLALYILRNDSLARSDKTTARIDSLTSWLGRKEKRSLPIRNKVPLFIRYFTCEGKPGGLVFYDDIYGEDKRLKEKYFVGK